MARDVYRFYENWVIDVKDRGLLVLPVHNGLLAQRGPNGASRGFWSNGFNRGWLERDE